MKRNCSDFTKDCLAKKIREKYDLQDLHFNEETVNFVLKVDPVQSTQPTPTVSILQIVSTPQDLQQTAAITTTSRGLHSQNSRSLLAPKNLASLLPQNPVVSTATHTMVVNTEPHPSVSTTVLPKVLNVHASPFQPATGLIALTQFGAPATTAPGVITMSSAQLLQVPATAVPLLHPAFDMATPRQRAMMDNKAKTGSGKRGRRKNAIVKNKGIDAKTPRSSTPILSHPPPLQVPASNMSGISLTKDTELSLLCDNIDSSSSSSKESQDIDTWSCASDTVLDKNRINKESVSPIPGENEEDRGKSLSDSEIILTSKVNNKDNLVSTKLPVSIAHSPVDSSADSNKVDKQQRLSTSSNPELKSTELFENSGNKDTAHPAPRQTDTQTLTTGPVKKHSDSENNTSAQLSENETNLKEIEEDWGDFAPLKKLLEATMERQFAKVMDTPITGVTSQLMSIKSALSDPVEGLSNKIEIQRQTLRKHEKLLTAPNGLSERIMSIENSLKQKKDELDKKVKEVSVKGKTLDKMQEDIKKLQTTVAAGANCVTKLDALVKTVDDPETGVIATAQQV